MKTLFVPLLLASLFASASAFALTASDRYGSPAAPAFTGRTIVIDSHTSYVNVQHGETVTIRAGADSISWNFDGNGSTFDLAQIMPAAMTAQPVKVYVAPAVLN